MPPDLRAKLERIAPHVFRVEGREGWELTGPVREALRAMADARAHGIRNLGDLARQEELEGNVDAGGLVIRGNYYAPEGATRILSNICQAGVAHARSLSCAVWRE